MHFFLLPLYDGHACPSFSNLQNCDVFSLQLVEFVDESQVEVGQAVEYYSLLEHILVEEICPTILLVDVWTQFVIWSFIKIKDDSVN